MLSVEARGQLTRLLMECVEECRRRLQYFAPFTPFSLAQKHDGHLRLAGGDLMPSDLENPLFYLYDLNYGDRRDYTALAIVHEVQTDERMRIYLEHVEGGGFRVWIPWHRLGDDNIRLEPPVIRATAPQIWPQAGGSAK
jgi:hypothetical protein